jgi:hypothetical protein
MGSRSIRRRIPGVAPLTLLLLCLFIGHPGRAQAQNSEDQEPRDPRSLEIPIGTVLPVRLNHALSSKRAKEGQAITGRIMQDVPLPNDCKIPEGAQVLGTILSVQRSANATNGRIAIRFDALAIHRNRIPISTNLRALAGFMEVQSAQTPEISPGFGTPSSWATTRQIGGDEVYGVGGQVTDQSSNTVGKGVFGGVLVHVRAGAGSQCHAAMDAEDRLQALWVFSSDACGVYGLTGVTIAHAGRTQPIGEIILTAEKKDVLIRGASGVLLRVNR